MPVGESEVGRGEERGREREREREGGREGGREGRVGCKSRNNFKWLS